SLRYGKSRALTTKPDRSAHTTGCLPRDRHTALATATASSEVRIVRPTSTSAITGAGLKKCRPSTSRGRWVAIAHSTTGRLDVVVASSTPGLQISSRFANRAFLTDS